MPVPAPNVTSAPSADGYLIGGRQLLPDSPGFAQAIAAAHGQQWRPLCLCRQGGDSEGVEMYVARLGDGYVLKRMPNTGPSHAADCSSFEPPADISGLWQVLGTGVKEDPATGRTDLQLGFAMSNTGGRMPRQTSASSHGSVVSEGTRLSMRGLLHYLWDQADLTRWRPAFDGKRTWAAVRSHLLRAAANKTVGGIELALRLYIPEPFSIARREAINSRRAAQLAQIIPSPGRPQPLMLLIAEVKEIIPARHGFKAVIKHVPDQPLMLDEQLYRRLAKRFALELALWASNDRLHMILIATIAVNEARVPTVAELSLMPVTSEWLPVENVSQQLLIESLVRERRSFIRVLRYELNRNHDLPTAVLTDVSESPSLVYADAAASHAEDIGAIRCVQAP